MDSELGSIGQKIVGRISNIVIAGFRRRVTHPGENVSYLLIIFYILGFHFQLGGIGQLVFENGWLILFAGCFFYFIPVLLYLNSSLFKSFRLARISRVISAFLCVISAFLMLGNLLGIVIEFSAIPIRTKISPSGELLSVYEREDPGFTPGNNGRCRHLILQSRVFPGILRNEVQLGKEVCLLNGNTFPPDLQ